MEVVVKIPAPLRRLTDGQREFHTEAGTVAECLERLSQAYPGMKDRLCEEDGSVRRFINIYVRGEDIRFSNGLDTALRDGDDVSIVPAASGG